MENMPVTVDSKGRVRASKEQRRLILAEFERSGVSGAQFAKRTGLKYSTLAGWLQRYRRTKPPGRARAVRLLEAVVMEQAHGGGQPPLATLQFPWWGADGDSQRPAGRLGCGVIAGPGQAMLKLLRQPQGVRWRWNRATCAKASTVCTRW